MDSEQIDSFSNKQTLLDPSVMNIFISSLKNLQKFQESKKKINKKLLNLFSVKVGYDEYNQIEENEYKDRIGNIMRKNKKFKTKKNKETSNKNRKIYSIYNKHEDKIIKYTTSDTQTKNENENEYASDISSNKRTKRKIYSTERRKLLKANFSIPHRNKNFKNEDFHEQKQCKINEIQGKANDFSSQNENFSGEEAHFDKNNNMKGMIYLSKEGNNKIDLLSMKNIKLKNEKYNQYNDKDYLNDDKISNEKYDFSNKTNQENNSCNTYNLSSLFDMKNDVNNLDVNILNDKLKIHSYQRNLKIEINESLSQSQSQSKSNTEKQTPINSTNNNNNQNTYIKNTKMESTEKELKSISPNKKRLLQIRKNRIKQLNITNTSMTNSISNPNSKPSTTKSNNLMSILFNIPPQTTPKNYYELKENSFIVKSNDIINKLLLSKSLNENEDFIIYDEREIRESRDEKEIDDDDKEKEFFSIDNKNRILFFNSNKVISELTSYIQSRGKTSIHTYSHSKISPKEIKEGKEGKERKGFNHIEVFEKLKEVEMMRERKGNVKNIVGNSKEEIEFKKMMKVIEEGEYLSED